MNQGASTSLLHVGLMASVYSVCSRRPSDNALVYHSHNEDSDDNVAVMKFAEVQGGFEAIAMHLYHCFGVRAHQKVLLACEGSAAAELLACLACVRLGAPFVPVQGGDHIARDAWPALIAGTDAVAAITVATNSNSLSSSSSSVSALALALRARGGCLLVLEPDGSIPVPSGGVESLSSVQPSTATTSTPSITAIPMPSYCYASVADVESDRHRHREEEGKEEETPLLYVLFTSGSSAGGVGKGVRGTQQGLLNRLAWQFHRFPFRLASKQKKASVVCRRAPLSSVDALVALFGPLLAGVVAYAPPACVLRRGDMLQLAVLASRRHVTHCTMLPSQLDQLCSVLRMGARCEGGGRSLWPSLEWLFVSGEECTRHIVERFHEVLSGEGTFDSRIRLLGSPSTRLVNLYGSTEVAGDVCCAELTLDSEHENESTVSIATEIIPGNVLYVARRRINTCGDDMSYELVAEGEEGELLVGGEQVCRGYIGCASAYAEKKFIRNPFADDSSAPVTLFPSHGTKHHTGVAPTSLYCTGDIVRVQSKSGAAGGERAMHFLRRCDSECLTDTVFKIRGGVRVCVAQMERILEATLVTLASQSSPPSLRPTDKGSRWNKGITHRQLARPSVVVAAVSPANTAVTCSLHSNVLTACVHTDLLKAIWVEGSTGNIIKPGERYDSARHHVVSLYDFILAISTSDGNSEEPGLRGAGGSAHGFFARQIRALTAALRQALMLQMLDEGTKENDQGKLRSTLTSAFLPLLFFSVECFSLTLVSGKYNRHNFRKQVQLWVYQLGESNHAESLSNSQSPQHEIESQGRINKRKRSRNAGHSDDDGSDHRPLARTKQCQACERLVVSMVLKVLPLADEQMIAREAVSPSSSLSFFALGGDSMSAVQLLWMIEQRCLGSNIESAAPWLRDEVIQTQLSKPLRCFIDFVFRHSQDAASTLYGSIGASSRHEVNHALIGSDNASRQLPNRSKDEDGSPGPEGQRSMPQDLSDQMKHFKFSKLWRCSFTKCIDASPLLVSPSSSPSTLWSSSSHVRGVAEIKMEGFLFVGSHNGEISCVDTVYGEKVWQHFLGSRYHVEGAMSFEPSSLICEPSNLPPSVPCVADNVSRTTTSSPVIRGGVVFVASYWAQDVDGEVIDEGDGRNQIGESTAGRAGRVWALSADSGTLLWHSGDVITGDVKGSPVVVRLRRVRVQATKETEAVRVVCVCSHDGCLYAFDAQTGALHRKLDVQRGALFASPVPYCEGENVEEGYANRLLLASTAGWVVSVSLALSDASSSISEVCLTLAVVWARSSANFAPVFGTPVVASCSPCPRVTTSPSCSSTDRKDSVGGVGGAKDRAQEDILLCICCTVGGECLCLEATSGRTVWSLSVAAASASSPIFSSPVAYPLLRRCVPDSRLDSAAVTVDDVGLVFGCHDGMLRVVSLQRGCILWTVDLQGAIFSSPTVVTVSSPKEVESEKIISPDAVTYFAFTATTAGELFALSMPTQYDDEHDSSSQHEIAILDRVSLPGPVFSSAAARQCLGGFSRHDCGATPSISPLSFPASKTSVFVAIGCRDDSVHAFHMMAQ